MLLHNGTFKIHIILWLLFVNCSGLGIFVLWDPNAVATSCELEKVQCNLLKIVRYMCLKLISPPRDYAVLCKYSFSFFS